MSYQKTVSLNDHEALMKLDKRTGEIAEVKSVGGNPNASYHISRTKFKKVYQPAMSFLSRHLTNEELGLVYKMIEKAKPYSNSLNPFNNETSLRTLEEHFGVSKNKVKRMLDRLFNMGVYGKFELVEENKEYTKYWILNPYIAFNGKTIDKGIQDLFSRTDIAKIVLGS